MSHESDISGDGFQLSVSRTLDLSVQTVFEAWIDGALRMKWLRRGDFEATTVKEPGTVRGKWTPDGSRVDVEISEASDGRCKLSISHRKLASAEAVQRMREFWKLSIGRFVERIGSVK